ncbi:MAG: hypothetical protein R3E97_02385 [Candidatus Eisenbacteria bacterium]
MSPWPERSIHLLPVGRRGRLAALFRTSALASAVLIACPPDRAGAAEIADFGNDFHPTMSPDGTRIAFYTYRTGLPEILEVDSHGRLIRNLSDADDLWDIQPVWSPDGKLIAWSSGANMGELGVRIARDDGEVVSECVRIEGRRTFFGGWSPDSKRIVVSVDDPETRQFAIYVCALDGSAATRVTKAPGSWTAPTFSPDGRMIAAGWKPERDSESRIQIMNADGTGVRTLRTGGSATSPAFSPDGKTLVYVSERDGNPEVYAIDLATEVESRLTTNDDPDRFPRYSFDGRSILWCSEANGTSDIWIMDASGSHPRNLTDTSCWSRCARLSPDGHHMVFESKRDGHSQIYIADPDGKHARALCAGPHADSTPTWSPKGDQIAFVRKLEDGLDIFVCGTDGSGLRNVTDVPGDDANPDFSPSGEWIAFDSTRDEEGAAEIYRVRVDGSQLQRITEHDGDDSNPSHTPDGRSLIFNALGDGNYDLYTVSVAWDGQPTEGSRTLGSKATGSQAAESSTSASQAVGSSVNGSQRRVDGARRLTNGERHELFGRVGPDGHSLVYISDETGDWEVYLSDLSLTTSHQPSEGAIAAAPLRLTDSRGPDWYPAWSPDGSEIIFDSNREGCYQIYRMSPAGEQVRAVPIP